MNPGEEELVIRGPVLIPVGWLIAILGCAGTGLVLAFGVGVWCASLSSDVRANTQDIDKLANVKERLTRIETILVYKFPEEAARADRQLASDRDKWGR